MMSSMDNAPPIVKFEQVGLRYGRGPEVLRDISFSLQQGDLVFLTGPSGAGKSSLLRLMYLALKPTRGRIEMFGQDVSTLSRPALAKLRRHFGVVFQDFRLLDHLTTFENVALPLLVRGERLSRFGRNVLELLEWVGLGHRVHARPRLLSGGEQQRAAIARAIVSRPEVLLADEPTGNVDPALARRLLRLFVELNRMGTTVVIATHDPALIAATPGALVMHLQEGRLFMHASDIHAPQMQGLSPSWQEPAMRPGIDDGFAGGSEY